MGNEPIPRSVSIQSLPCEGCRFHETIPAVHHQVSGLAIAARSESAGRGFLYAACKLQTLLAYIHTLLFQPTCACADEAELTDESCCLCPSVIGMLKNPRMLVLVQSAKVMFGTLQCSCHWHCEFTCLACSD